MEGQDLREIVSKYRWYILYISIGIVLVLIGVISFTKQVPFLEESKIEILESSKTGEVTVEIAGAVERPGVYKFPVGSRIDELLITAGGLSINADREWVAKILNRAAKLTDGQKVFIRSVGESAIQSIGNRKTGISDNQIIEASDGLININEASQAQFEALSGIGPVTAKKIIDNRPYASVEELITRKILKQKVYEDNKDRLSVY